MIPRRVRFRWLIKLMLKTDGVASDNELELIGTKSCNLWDAYRKFANRDISRIADAIYSKGPLTLGELRAITGIDTNLLNRDLIEMRKVEIIKKAGKKYHLTVYGGILKESIDKIKSKLSDVDMSGLFEPIEEQEALTYEL